LSADMVDAWIDVQVRTASGSAEREPLREWFQTGSFPDSLPFFDDFAVGPNGGIWLSEVKLPGRNGPTAWIAFGHDGTPVARIEVPREFRVLTVLNGIVLGVWADPLGVETVRVFGLDRTDQG
jgi:hypothetical protein